MHPPHEIALRYRGLTGKTTLTVLVEPGVAGHQLEALAEHLAEQHSATRVCYIDFQELLQAGCSLGYWDVELGPRLRDKDWSKRPDQTDVEMWSEYMQAQIAQEKFRTLARRHGLAVDEVMGRVEKVSSWIAT